MVNAFLTDKEKIEYSYRMIRKLKDGIPSNSASSVDWNNILNVPDITKSLSDIKSLGVASTNWVTIAEADTARAYGEFFVWDNQSSRHNFVKIIATTAYGQNTTLALGGNRYSTRTIAHMRILYNTADRVYGGAKLQVYCENPSFTLFTRSFLLDQFNGWDSWTLIDPIIEGTPSGWSEDTTTRVDDITNTAYGLQGKLKWGDLVGVPSTFPPSTHSHTWSQISGGSTGLIPTSGSSGTWTSVNMSGSKGGYAGIYFTDYARYLMVNASIQGFHTGSTWQWYFSNGSLTAGTVPWARLTGVPSTFTPSSHTHASGDLPNAFTALWSGNASTTGTRTMTSYSGYSFLIVVGFMDQASSENAVSVTIPVGTISTNARRYSLHLSYDTLNSYLHFSFPSATQFRIDNVYGSFVENIQWIYGVKII